MTKDSVPVCGALTRAGTQCQNTLVTSCGRCPVHASQLRASKPALKPATRARRKKPPIQDDSLLNALAASPQQQPSDAVLLNTPDASRALAFQDSTHVSDDAFQALGDTSMHSFDTTSDFQTPLQGLTVFLKDGQVHVRRKPPLCSPVTPNTPERRFDELYEGEDHSALTTGATVLHAPEEALDLVELAQIEGKGGDALPSSINYEDEHF